jgi:uncharacterized membrane protein
MIELSDYFRIVGLLVGIVGTFAVGLLLFVPYHAGLAVKGCAHFACLRPAAV